MFRCKSHYQQSRKTGFFLTFPICMSSQSKCNTTNKTEAKSTTSDSKKIDEKDKYKSPNSRFAKRNYRRRSDSQSTDSSVPMDEPMPEQRNTNETTPNGNRQVLYDT